MTAFALGAAFGLSIWVLAELRGLGRKLAALEVLAAAGRPERTRDLTGVVEALETERRGYPPDSPRHRALTKRLARLAGR